MSRPAGFNHSEETRRKIGNRARERYAAIAALPHPDKKKCVRCGEWKDTVRDFTWKGRLLVDGTRRPHPVPRCKACERDRLAEYKQRIGVEEYNRRERETRARRVRERRAARIAGVQLLEKVDAEPFRRFWEDLGPELKTLVRQAEPSLTRTINRVMSGEHERHEYRLYYRVAGALNDFDIIDRLDAGWPDNG